MKRVIYGRPLPKVNPRFANLEQVFRTPPMTQELVRAVVLLAPHLQFVDFGPNETSRAFWESEQNAACWAEYDCLKGTFLALPKPMRVLEIGPGTRSLACVFQQEVGMAGQ